MLVELVKTTTSDGVRLDGALHCPARGISSIGVDAFVFLHGVGGNFYGGSLFENLTASLVELGAAVLSVNTRGHDGMNTAVVTGRRKRQGAAYESVDECRFDVAAWCDFLTQRGYQRIGLLGHSLGAIKAVYAQAHQPHSAVCAVVAASPPRLSYSYFNNGERSSDFFAIIRQAQQHVSNGKSDTLMEVDFPFPIVITAAGYLDKYGREERYNIVEFAGRLTIPTLFVYGQRELESGGVAFAGVPDALKMVSPSANPFDIVIMDGADHFYSGVYEVLAQEVRAWLTRRFPAGE